MNENTLACGACGRPAHYHFARTDAAPDLRCLRHALVYPPVFWRAVRVALVVGTILFLINQADVALAGKVTVVTACKIALTYLVPYSVSTYSALQINRIPPASCGAPLAPQRRS